MSKNEFPPLFGDGGATPEFVAVVDASGQTSLVIDQGLLLLTAQFVRSGPDLILVGKDGSRVLVINFFSSENPPDLYTLNGARIDGRWTGVLPGLAVVALGLWVFGPYEPVETETAFDRRLLAEGVEDLVFLQTMEMKALSLQQAQ